MKLPGLNFPVKQVASTFAPLQEFASKEKFDLLFSVAFEMLADFGLEKLRWLDGHSGQTLDKFEDGHLIVHPGVFCSLLSPFLTLVAGLIEVRLSDKDQP